MLDLSRRKFLEDSMFAAAAAVAAGAASPLFAQEQASKSPNERLSVAVVGCGGRGNSHIGAYAGKSDTSVNFICDVDETIGRNRCEQVGKQQEHAPQYVQDIRQLLDDKNAKNVNIVTIATPNHWHSLAAIWAIQAGKDVYVEKPVSHNVSEGRRVFEAARHHKKIVQTGTQCRSNPGTYEAIDFIRAGGVGDVKLARGLCYKGRPSIGPKGDYPIPSDVNYDLWCGPAPMDKLTRKKFHYDWHWIWNYGNGDLGNQGIHQMDLARWGLGVDSVGDGVLSYGGRLGYDAPDAGETANTQVSIHTFGDKTLVFEVRGLKTDALRGAKVGVIYYGSKGYVVLPTYDGGAAFDLEGNKIKEFKGGGDSLHFNNFLKAVRSRKHEDLNADIWEGHLSSALCHLGNISYRLGAGAMLPEVNQALASDKEAAETLERFSSHLKDNNVDLEKTQIQFGAKLKLDPAAETFIGNSQADAMLTREYRAPYVVPAAGKV